MNKGIIIQARTGSTRLPRKITMNFHEGMTILDIIIERLKHYFSPSEIILATSTKVADAQLEAVALRHKISFFQGDESDVLRRFIAGAEHFDKNLIVRICADNPFLLPEYIAPLIQSVEKGVLEYTSYEWPDQTPVMKSHIGLFAEAFTLDFLKRIDRKTNALHFHEHVTNYLYTHKSDFSFRFLPVPNEVKDYPDIRLTIDTKDDFIIAQEVYKDWISLPNQNIETLVQCIQNKPLLLEKMKKEIEKNAK